MDSRFFFTATSIKLVLPSCVSIQSDFPITEHIMIYHKINQQQFQLPRSINLSERQQHFSITSVDNVPVGLFVTQILFLISFQWQIQDFPDRRAPTYYLTIFSRKLHENKEIWPTKGRVSCAPTNAFFVLEKQN